MTPHLPGCSHHLWFFVNGHAQSNAAYTPLFHYYKHYCKILSILLEQVSTKYRKTKPKVITLANHKQYSEPIKTPTKYMPLIQSTGKHLWANRDFGLTSDWMRKWPEIFTPITKRSGWCQTRVNANYFRHLKEKRVTDKDQVQRLVKSLALTELGLFVMQFWSLRKKLVFSCYQFHFLRERDNLKKWKK